MIIPVIYLDGKQDLVKDFRLTYLITRQEIIKFKRRDGWVNVSSDLLSLLILLFHWKVMDIQMAGKTFGEHFQQFSSMRFWWGVAVGTIRDQPVPGMAAGTADLTMFAGGCRPFGINRIVTNRTGFQVDGFSQGDIQGLMDVMALRASVNGLCLKMRRMTLITGRNVSVTIMVTRRAFLLGMFAGSRF